MGDRGSSYDDMSLEELCAPLSASRASEDAFKTRFGKSEVSDARVKANQRNAVANKKRTISSAARKAGVM